MQATWRLRQSSPQNARMDPRPLRPLPHLDAKHSRPSPQQTHIPVFIPPRKAGTGKGTAICQEDQQNMYARFRTKLSVDVFYRQMCSITIVQCHSYKTGQW